jgi:electron transport complex protein RnfB
MTFADALIAILFSFLTIAGLGCAFGIFLALAHSAFQVKKDERIDLIEQALPGLNCGICGYAGCVSYAEYIGLGNGDIMLCLPGGDEAAGELARITGIDHVPVSDRKVTQVHCRSGKSTSKYDFKYTGLEDCNAAAALFGGDKTCKQGCLGLGSCIRVCPVDAIASDTQGLVWVDSVTCIGCGKCVDVCPTRVMRFIPGDSDMVVACNSRDSAREKRKYCTVSCIACKICEKQSPDGGYKVEAELSIIDYTARGERERGRLGCPTSCIVRNDLSR